LNFNLPNTSNKITRFTHSRVDDGRTQGFLGRMGRIPRKSAGMGSGSPESMYRFFGPGDGRGAYPPKWPRAEEDSIPFGTVSPVGIASRRHRQIPPCEAEAIKDISLLSESGIPASFVGCFGKRFPRDSN
jgi:hypothetical protein